MSDLKELSQSQVPLEKVAPLQSNRLVTFVNHFIVSIVQQLNELSSVVDSRLFDINNQIVRCNTNLVILEMKLNSISGLTSAAEATTGPTSEPVSQLIAANAINEVSGSPSETIPAHLSGQSPDSTQTERNEENHSNSKKETETDAKEPEQEPEDPRLAKYKKMVQLGIPLAAVRQKMSLEGVDPELLS